MSEDAKEIESCLLACAEGLGVPLPTREREALTRRLLPLNGADLFRILWSLPERFQGKPFPSGEVIEKLVRGHMSAKAVQPNPNRLKPPPARGAGQVVADKYAGEIMAKIKGSRSPKEGPAVPSQAEQLALLMPAAPDLSLGDFDEDPLDALPAFD